VIEHFVEHFQSCRSMQHSDSSRIEIASGDDRRQPGICSAFRHRVNRVDGGLGFDLLKT